MGNQDSRTEKVTLQKVQANKDPFRYAWFFSIPDTNPTKAVFEFYRYENRWSPYKWNGLSMNPRFPRNAPSEVFDLINRSCKPHPLPTYKKKLMIYLLAFYLPAILLALLLYIYLLIALKQYTVYIFIVYLIFIIGMTAGTLIAAVRGSLKYYSDLDERVKSLEGLISDLNNSRYLARGFRFAVGEQGAWIEVQFLDQNLYMVWEGAGTLQGSVAPTAGFVQNGDGVNSLAKPLSQNQGDGYIPF